MRKLTRLTAKLRRRVSDEPPSAGTKLPAFRLSVTVWFPSRKSSGTDSVSPAVTAKSVGTPPSVVGVTVVSIGTTLPELVTGLLAVRKGQSDLAMGNALGSCIFNAGAIFSVVGLVSPPVVDRSLMLPLLYMAILALSLVPISRSFGKTVSRLEGAVLLGSYVLFLAVSAVLASLR